MAFDAFLKIDGIVGESTDAKHEGWIELASYEFSAMQPVSTTTSSAGGASAGRVEMHDFFFSKLVDKATPKLFEAACSGKHIKEVIVEVCRAGGDQQKFLEIRMEQVLVSSYSHQAGKEFPSEAITLNCGVFKIVYAQQKRTDGTMGGNVAAGWDFIQNKQVA